MRLPTAPAAAVVVGLVAAIALFVAFMKLGYPAFKTWLAAQLDRRLPPSWPRPQGTAPTTAPTAPTAPTGGGGTPAPGAPSADPPSCPNGSGLCSSDDGDPKVAPVPVDTSCEHVSEADFQAWKNKQKWYDMLPVLGPLWQSVDAAVGRGDPMQKILDYTNRAAIDLREATVQWQNSYMQILGTLGADILPVTQALLDPHAGLVALTSEVAAMPLNHAAYMLIAPILGLLTCSAALAWAV